MSEVLKLVNTIKSKDKKERYKALDSIMWLSRSRKAKQKAELLKILNEKSFSDDWEKKYIAMYGISRVRWRFGKFDELKKAYKNVLRLLEDSDGRVRVAALNALDRNFKGFFISFELGECEKFSKEEIVKLWMDSLFFLWDKTKTETNYKIQYHLMRCVDVLFRPDMNCYLNAKEYSKYKEVWAQIQELNELYNEYGMDDKLFMKMQKEALGKWNKQIIE
ncbi:MAG: hypothetical protein ABIC04_03360 [Nanoarchaeota archaeon]